MGLGLDAYHVPSPTVDSLKGAGLLPCLELLWTNMESEQAMGEPDLICSME